MPKVAVALAILTLALVVLRARPLTVLGVYAVTAVAVPGTLGMPYTNTSYATVHHVLVAAGLVRLVLGLVDRTLPAGVLRLTRVHAVLGGLLLVSFGVGIVAAPTAGPLGFAGARLADVADQCGLFVVCLALVRQVADLRKVLAACSVALLVGALIATVEHLTGDSWGRFLFANLPAQANTSAAFQLSERAGTLRVRAGAEFALQFGWLVVMLVPALVVTALSTPRVRGAFARTGLAGLGAGVAALVVYWSFTRTALAAVVVAVALTALLARQRPLLLLSGGLLGLAALAYVLVPSVADHLDASADVGAIDVRSERLGPVMDLVSRHPIRGVGLGGLVTSGFQSVDNALLLHYVELGAIGVVTLVAVLLVALLTALRPVLLCRTEGDRLVAAAAATGVVAFVASSLTYDAFTLVQGGHLLWLLVAVSVVLAERRLPAPAAVPQRALRLVAGGLVGLLAGLAVYAFAPVHVGQRLLLTTLPLAKEVAPFDPVTGGRRFVVTGCGAVEAIRIDRVEVDCVDKQLAAGVGQLRVVAPDQATLTEAVAELTRLLRIDVHLGFAQLLPLEQPRSGRSSLATTAPVWATLGMMVLLSLLPAGGWRRARGPRPPEHGSAALLPVLPPPAELVRAGR